MTTCLFCLFLTTFCFSQQILTGKGASFPHPIYSLWGARNSDVILDYIPAGSSAGIKAAANRETLFGGTDVPLSSKDLARDNLIQIPTVIGAVVPIAKLASIKNLQLSGDILAAIFSGEITHWNNSRIRALNPSKELPNKRIITVGRSDGSGTTAIFTSYLSKSSPLFRKSIGSDKHVPWQLTYFEKGNFNVAQRVKSTPNSIGYVQYNYAHKMRLMVPSLKSSNNISTANPQSFQKAALSAVWSISNNFKTELVDVNASGWPLISATFMLIPQELLAEIHISYLRFCFEKGDLLAKKLNYVPLPKKVQETILAYLKEELKLNKNLLDEQRSH